MLTLCKERLPVYDEDGKRVGFIGCALAFRHKGEHEYTVFIPKRKKPLHKERDHEVTG